MAPFLTLAFSIGRAVAGTAAKRNSTTTTTRVFVSASGMTGPAADPEYPGTAVDRMEAVRDRVRSLTDIRDGGMAWEEVRRRLLWAGGLRDLPAAIPGQGYTGHSFNDFNHVDLTCMLDADDENTGNIPGIAYGNFLGQGIRIASLPELGPGGSWSTCMMGCQHEPPKDVAHVQFRARIAFKLVWVPPEFTEFVLVDDAGELLQIGRPDPAELPRIQERQKNYRIVAGSKYAAEADKLSASGAATTADTA